MYENRSHPPLGRRRFVGRMLRHAAVALALILVSLAAGMAGYAHFERLAWRDAFLNAAMLLGGMGPVDAPRTDAGKVFAGLYALYAGLVFLAAAGVLFVPIVHRLLHRFHWSEDR
ncbi:MAG TPA: hypothetical protein PKD87_06700 [Burkholderiaceae bacterium]|jgi:hypothetical protein|nr:hypothetical protein [Burkholderiaceae bacterium]